MFCFVFLVCFLVIISSGKGTATIVRTLRTPMFGGVSVRGGRGVYTLKGGADSFMKGGGWGGVVNNMKGGERVGVDGNTERGVNDNMRVTAEVDYIMRVVAVDVDIAVVAVRVDRLNNSGRFSSFF